MFSRLSSISLAVLAAALCSKTAQAATLTEVYQNNDFQLTGVSVSKSGRLFTNFPRWSDRYLYAVVEIMPDGSTKPFPDQEWNQWNLKPKTAGNHFVCVQSIVVDDNDMLWVVDPAAPLLAADVPHGPKLVEINLKTNLVERIIPVGPAVAKEDSYLNDIRIDVTRQFAYLTDSGHPGIIVVNLKTGQSQRALDGHPSTLIEPGVQVVVDGKTLLQYGKPPQFASDSIALSPDGDWLYYKAVTANTLWRVRTDVLRDPSTSPAKQGAAVEKVATTFPTDGLWMDKSNNLYLTDVTHNAVTRLTPDGKLEQVATDDRLQWPDTFSQGPDGAIYVTASHINESPNFHQGKSVRTTPFSIFKLMP